MKKYPWILLSGGLVALAFAPGACGGGTGTTTTTAGTGGASSSTTSTHAASTGVVTATGSGGSMGCTGLLSPGTCTTCLEASCCNELAACNDDASGNCLPCSTGSASDTTVCADPATTALSDALAACVQSSCKDPCTPPPAMTPDCNPVTNEGCKAGEACDFGQDANMQQTFQCYPPPPANTQVLCAACDDMATACLGGLSCVMGKCAKFCCSDSECGTGKCTATNAFNVGICFTDPTAQTPACDAQPTAVSQGGCVQWTGASDGGTTDGGTGGSSSSSTASSSGTTTSSSSSGGINDAGSVDASDGG